MINWFLDKNSKIPLYLQLKDLIKYYISTGAVNDNEKLPGVVNLSKELMISFETVCKAYKELELEGLISMQRGKGSFVSLQNVQAAREREGVEIQAQLEPEKELKRAIKRLLKNGKSEKHVESLVREALNSTPEENAHFFVIFTECSEFQVNEISKILKKQLNLEVKPVLIEDLKTEIDRVSATENRLLSIITTGFHLNEVWKIVGHRSLDVQILITYMCPETRSRLASFSKKARFGLICRDKESVAVFTDMLKTEFGKDINLSACILSDEATVDKILGSVDVLLVTPAVCEPIQKRTSGQLPVFNIFDSVEPISLKMVQSNISRKIESLNA
jgi:GntR family transcriptional regulator